MTEQRVLPHNSDVESSVIGYILLHPTSGIVTELHHGLFFEPANRSIFGVITELAAEDVAFDSLVVRDRLASENEIIDADKQKLDNYLFALGNQRVYHSTIETHIAMLRRFYVQRTLIRELAGLEATAYEPQRSASDVYDIVSGVIERLCSLCDLFYRECGVRHEH